MALSKAFFIAARRRLAGCASAAAATAKLASVGAPGRHGRPCILEAARYAHTQRPFPSKHGGCGPGAAAPACVLGRDAAAHLQAPRVRPQRAERGVLVAGAERDDVAPRKVVVLVHFLPAEPQEELLCQFAPPLIVSGRR